MTKDEQLKNLRQEINDLRAEIRSLTRVRLCLTCGGFAKRSKGFGNAYIQSEDGPHTIPGESGRYTIYPGAGGLIDCWKCTNCGHSWT